MGLDRKYARKLLKERKQDDWIALLDFKDKVEAQIGTQGQDGSEVNEAGPKPVAALRTIMQAVEALVDEWSFIEFEADVVKPEPVSFGRLLRGGTSCFKATCESLNSLPGTGGNCEDHWGPSYKILLGKNTDVPGGGLGYDGNLASSWMLTFWPSTRKHIDRFISFAGDFGGTSVSSVVTNELTRRQGRGSAPANHQQSFPSNFLTAALAKGNKFAWVPTTSLYSATDAIVQPEGIKFNDTRATSYLGGEAGNLLAQGKYTEVHARWSNVSDDAITGFCSSGIVGVVAHQTWQYSNMGYQIVLMALAAPRGFVTQAEAVAAVAAGVIPCDTLPAPGLNATSVLAIETAVAISGYRLVDPQYYVPVEPPLKDYVATFPDNRLHSY
ncbi:hypothetical protein RQP46_005707 [Phenoliferia psychrophenolica]